MGESSLDWARFARERGTVEERRLRTSLLRFRELGHVGPLPLLGADECARALERLRRQERPPLDWHKGWAAASADYFSFADDDRVRALVTALLGGDVLLWGASLVVRKPGDAHPWHTDIETAAPDAEAVSVWIGLDGTTEETSLSVVSRSHEFGTPLQRVAAEGGIAREHTTDAQVACWARERDPRAAVATHACTDGQALLFDGRLWHASHNRGASRTRHALLLQFATPRTPIRIPNPARLEWPFESHEVPRPPCIVVSGGADPERNRIVPAPIPARGDLAVLSAGIHPLALPLARDPDAGWMPRRLFQGMTSNLQRIGSHVSVLEPGLEAHPPHLHDEEELLLVLDGAATLVHADAGDPQRLVLDDAAAGCLAYYPAGSAHTLRCDAAGPVTYLMFKWRGHDRAPRAQLGCRLVRSAEANAPLRQHGRGFATQTLLDGETGCLRRLHVHRTTLAPGAGYTAHVDAHDVAIVVLQGAIETLGARVTRNGVAFCASGQPHDMRNPGTAPAAYLVFEFHGRRALLLGAQPERQPRAAPGRTRSLLRSLWRGPFAP